MVYLDLTEVNNKIVDADLSLAECASACERYVGEKRLFVYCNKDEGCEVPGVTSKNSKRTRCACLKPDTTGEPIQMCKPRPAEKGRHIYEYIDNIRKGKARYVLGSTSGLTISTIDTENDNAQTNVYKGTPLYALVPLNVFCGSCGPDGMYNSLPNSDSETDNFSPNTKVVDGSTYFHFHSYRTSLNHFELIYIF